MILARNTKVLQIAILNWMGGLNKIAIIENLKYEYHRKKYRFHWLELENQTPYPDGEAAKSYDWIEVLKTIRNTTKFKNYSDSGEQLKDA